MEAAKMIFNGLSNIGETMAYESKLSNDGKKDIYHEWFSTLRIRQTDQLEMIEDKLNSRIVRQALKNTLQDMLQENDKKLYLESTKERAKQAIVELLQEYFITKVLFFIAQSEDTSSGFNINRSLFFYCLINAAEASFNISSTLAKNLVHEVVQKYKNARSVFDLDLY